MGRLRAKLGESGCRAEELEVTCGTCPPGAGLLQEWTTVVSKNSLKTLNKTNYKKNVGIGFPNQGLTVKKY